ncbi:hypothetical protein BDP27DRAFT_1448550 [Rhodocollybia butyracea]|uniref:Uncharacterized protein n=1 Tax=Rhodocollybia butyracea TaxID=206335 RepID=A0A9P5U6W6_9AGAR|nr:hypothetical protein BDP27DRAFT_1448550 [Rhodocollybia butyracea]
MMSISFKLPLTLTCVSVLLCTSLLVSMPVQVGSSPLPDHENRAINLVQRNNEKVSYPLSLWASQIGTEQEHVSLVMHDVLVQGVVAKSMNDFETPLIGHYAAYHGPTTTEKTRIIKLNENVEFASRHEFEAEVLKLSKMTLAPHKPIDEGGNCVDYIKKALEELVEEKALAKMPATFTAWYGANYKRISEGTWIARHKKAEAEHK